MEKIALIAYIVLGVLSCIVIVLGYLASKQVGNDGSCDEEAYKRLIKYLKWIMITFGIMILEVFILVIYVLLI